MNIPWKDWCWSWSSNTLATWCEELTHLKRPWLGMIEGRRRRDDRGWDGWMASPTRWTWIWVNSGSWWRTGRTGVLQSMGSQRVGHNWPTELNWTDNLRRVVRTTIPQCAGEYPSQEDGAWHSWSMWASVLLNLLRLTVLVFCNLRGVWHVSSAFLMHPSSLPEGCWPCGDFLEVFLVSEPLCLLRYLGPWFSDLHRSTWWKWWLESPGIVQQLPYCFQLNYHKFSDNWPSRITGFH